MRRRIFVLFLFLFIYFFGGYPNACLTSNWSVDVEVEAILTLVTEERQETLEVVVTALWHASEGFVSVGDIGHVLGTHWGQGVGLPDALPPERRRGGHESQVTNGGRGVGYPEEHGYRGEVSVVGPYDETPEAPLVGAHHVGRPHEPLHAPRHQQPRHARCHRRPPRHHAPHPRPPRTQADQENHGVGGWLSIFIFHFHTHIHIS